MRWQAGVDDKGNNHVINDPLAPTTAACLTGKTTTAARVEALLTIDTIFPTSLASDKRFHDTLVESLGLLETQGARRALIQFSTETNP